jgi:cyclooctatin synthase
MSSRGDEAGRGLDNRETRDQVFTIILAGIETTASLLAWTFHLLSHNPEIEQRLLAEIDGVVADAPPAFGDLPRLRYLERVLTETLRLYPPAWIISRTAITPTTLAGVPVPAGADVLFSPYCVHRDPAIFRDPEQFDPDRWLPENTSKAQREAFLTFGAGPRKCLGQEFSMTEAALIVATVLQNYRLRPGPGTSTRPARTISLRPSALHMVVESRTATTPALSI